MVFLPQFFTHKRLLIYISAAYNCDKHDKFSNKSNDYGKRD